MTWSRRRFVGWGVGAAGLAVLGGWIWGRRDAADLIVAILERRVGFLRVDRATFRTFAEEYVRANPRHHSRLAMASVMAGPLQWVRPHQWGGSVGGAFRRLDDSVVSTYLLSTDFFDHGADETREVSYVTYFSPLSGVCRNPFARQAGA